MTVIFLKLLNMSVAAGWAVLAVLLLRGVCKKAPKWAPQVPVLPSKYGLEKRRNMNEKSDLVYIGAYRLPYPACNCVGSRRQLYWTRTPISI